MLAFANKDTNEVATVDQRRQVRIDQQDKTLARGSRPGSDFLAGIEEAFDALEADKLERRLFRSEIVVQAGLTDAEHVGNVLGGSPMETALGKDACGRLNDLRRAAALARHMPSRRESEDVHARLSYDGSLSHRPADPFGRSG